MQTLQDGYTGMIRSFSEREKTRTIIYSGGMNKGNIFIPGFISAITQYRTALKS